MSEQPTLVKAHPLEEFAVGKLSTRESLIRQIQHRVRAELVSEKVVRPTLNGALGEQIAIAAGSWDMEFVEPDDIAEGICSWLDTYFLQLPPGIGPRDGNEDPSPPPSSEGADGSRVGALVHLPTLIRQEFGISASEARRLVGTGGVAIDGVRVDQDELDVPAEVIDGAELRIGRKRGKRIDLKEAS